jgi:hypothetical protein
MQNAWKEFIAEDRDFELARKNYSDEFYKIYNDAFDSYTGGDWNKAKKLLVDLEVISFNLEYYREN